ncbi:MAG: hypothetical protein LBL00_05510 [Endomicrobium sp.]|jgi:hypothetical protein|nr:hypothetical protein [Endomicrobium sp.]
MKQENKLIILAAVLIIGLYVGFKYLPKHLTNPRAEQSKQAKTARKTNGKTEPAPIENKPVQCSDWMLQEYTLSVKNPAILEMIGGYARVDVIVTYKTEKQELIAETLIQNARAFSAQENENGGTDIKLCVTPTEAEAMKNGISASGEILNEPQYDISVRNSTDLFTHTINASNLSKLL